MIITIFYHLSFIIDLGIYFWRFLAIPKLLMAMSILTPGYRGEFYLYELMLPYILLMERSISEIRSNVFSMVVKQLQKLVTYMLNRTITFVSEDCLLSCKERMQFTLQLIKDEVVSRKSAREQQMGSPNRDQDEDFQLDNLPDEDPNDTLIEG